jgi:hypothetical protein
MIFPRLALTYFFKIDLRLFKNNEWNSTRFYIVMDYIEGAAEKSFVSMNNNVFYEHHRKVKTIRKL